MAEERVQRRLAAILVADIAGYSALIGVDEAGTVRVFKGHMTALEPIIGLNGGRIVKSTGDGFLAEFSSVVDAVSCAAVMQRQMAKRNQDQPDDRQLVFRMGVHVGDIIVDGDDILGDGVNIAARLEGIAVPGGVAISGRVYEDVVNKLDLAFEDLGPQELKNIARPVVVYALAIDAPKMERPTLALPDKPSVAVLAFENLSTDAEQEYFADGVTEDIITALSYVPWLFVIARNSSFSYKGLAVDVRKIGRELGVRYVLEGSVRRGGNRLRVTGQLVDAETGNHLWANHYDGTPEDVFDLQDRITEEVVGAIAPEIRSAEIARARRKRPDSLDAYDYFLRALAAINSVQIDDAETNLDAALSSSPSFAKAKAMKAWCQTLLWRLKTVGDETTTMALDLAEEALEASDADLETQAYAGYTIAFFGRDFPRGIGHLERAISKCPSFAWGWTSSSLLHAYRGEVDKAIERSEQALRLSPYDPMVFRTCMALSIAHMTAKDFVRVLKYSRLGLELNSRVIYLLPWKIAALAHLGQMDEARSMAERFVALEPNASIGKIRKVYERNRVASETLWHPLYEGLRKAGVPE
jgi:adenylate cyclase